MQMFANKEMGVKCNLSSIIGMHGASLPHSSLYVDHRHWRVHCSYMEHNGPCSVHYAPCRSQSCSSGDAQIQKHSAVELLTKRELNSAD